MKVLNSFLVLLAFVAIAKAQAPSSVGGPPILSPGYLIGQEASKNAVNFAINNAIATNADPSTLSPEFQEELQKILDNAQVSLKTCDDVVTSGAWRYKVCKFQELAKIKLQLSELKLKAAAAAATTAAPSDAESAAQPNAESA